MHIMVDKRVLRPLDIIFTSVRNGAAYETGFYDTSATPLPNGDYNSTGNYAISLPNRESYAVKIRWQMNEMFTWTTDVGTLDVNTTKTSITQDWSVQGG